MHDRSDETHISVVPPRALGPVPLRERKRVGLLIEIRRTALNLFAERGFDEVTAEEIAAAVGISKSTFFRHVPSKDALLIDPLLEGSSGMVDVSEAQPPDRTAQEALATAAVECARAISMNELSLWRRAVRTAPALTGRISFVGESDSQRLTKFAAERLRLHDPDHADAFRAGLLVTVIVAVSSYVLRNWILDDSSNDVSLADQLESALSSVVVS